MQDQLTVTIQDCHNRGVGIQDDLWLTGVQHNKETLIIFQNHITPYGDIYAL